MLKKCSIALLVSFFLSACGDNAADLQTVHQQQAGDYTITILSETGAIQNGTSEFVLEFRRSSDNQLADVGSVEVAPIMEMPGMGPMMGTAAIMPDGTPGRYRVTSSLSMAGAWKFDVKFGAGESARININAQ